MSDFDKIQETLERETVYNAVISEVVAPGRYKVDLYQGEYQIDDETGEGLPTKKGILAFRTINEINYVVDAEVQVKLITPNIAIILPPMLPLAFDGGRVLQTIGVTGVPAGTPLPWAARRIVLR